MELIKRRTFTSSPQSSLPINVRTSESKSLSKSQVVELPYMQISKFHLTNKAWIKQGILSPHYHPNCLASEKYNRKFSNLPFILLHKIKIMGESFGPVVMEVKYILKMETHRFHAECGLSNQSTPSSCLYISI